MAYSKKELKEKVLRVVKDYELAINQMTIFMKSEYAHNKHKL